MFKKIECVSIYTPDIEASAAFYGGLGLVAAWRIERPLAGGGTATLLGLRFPDSASSELVLSDNADVKLTEIEILVDDVHDAYVRLSEDQRVGWIREPFATESGHVAVMTAPDGNVFVLVGR
ncbi:hypothetical protein OSH11_04185 [Kaistia dalseonensis]|uniref:Catechol 2,3-dioxygenase-like lactoylglutathione lyase family enzyme n=1 Tax=Kaistia dalseonensis TaxID=410840 RepID=A0ABU0H2C3_9HYPH|nr:VOC family protein [Kaistia dalseonensis]MCX5493892.1 hypothetical protein [Kaistia dalseonensis]MDQ0436458.1 catechol 2,3-dioxygenase-like lactoylglutathione lyase family enzyme [Kaistia dalseonensis]